MSQQLDGLVIKDQSGYYHVETADGSIYICRLRGRLKEEAQASDIAAIGDRVTVTPDTDSDGIDDLRGIIETVHERHNALSRAVRTTGKRGAGQAEREHVLIANPDQALFVFAMQQPSPNWKMLDRLLVTSESAEIDDVVIVINKVDLALDFTLNDSYLQVYRDMGYTVIFTSAVAGIGLDDLRDVLRDKISVLTGPSGVGKTSLLNHIQAGLGRATKSVSEHSQEGMHTTRDSELVKLEFGGYLADTPGIRQLALWDVEPDELDAYFLDMADYVPACRFSNCTHTNEPGCAIIAAVANGEVSQRRYHHFLELREELRATYIVY